LICPECKGSLIESQGVNECRVCHKQWPIIDGIPSFILDKAAERTYYETWHYEQTLVRKKGILRQVVREIIKPFRYFTTRRERLFRRAFRECERGPILDIACGIGQPFYKEFGSVIGVDLSLNALKLLQQRGLYEKVIHADAGSLPFPDQTFKYLVSADFFGHVPISDKDKIIREMARVLVPGGIMAQVIETDSVNLFFRFAHRYPDLFRKYFVEQIGGHYGLEMPSKVVHRFQNHGFKVLQVYKMWGPVWETREYVKQFSNEYVAYNHTLRMWVTLCRLSSANPLTMVIADALLGMVSKYVDRFQPFDCAQGIFLVTKKDQ